jgi:DNA-binding MarR family transcriptional regulator
MDGTHAAGDLLAMTRPSTSPLPPNAIAESVLQIGRVAESLGYAGGLKPSQWTALRFFATAVPQQRTVSGLAEFHATTRGAASQMVEVLVGKGLLTRQLQARDRRVVLLSPTPLALNLLAADPMNELTNLIDGLGQDEQYVLADLLGRILKGMLQKRK